METEIRKKAVRRQVVNGVMFVFFLVGLFIFTGVKSAEATTGATVVPTSINSGETKSFVVTYNASSTLSSVIFQFGNITVSTSDSYTVDGVTSYLTLSQISNGNTVTLTGLSTSSVLINLNNKSYDIYTTGPNQNTTHEVAQVAVSPNGGSPTSYTLYQIRGNSKQGVLTISPASVIQGSANNTITLTFINKTMYNAAMNTQGLNNGTAALSGFVGGPTALMKFSLPLNFEANASTDTVEFFNNGTSVGERALTSSEISNNGRTVILAIPSTVSIPKDTPIKLRLKNKTAPTTGAMPFLAQLDEDGVGSIYLNRDYLNYSLGTGTEAVNLQFPTPTVSGVLKFVNSAGQEVTSATSLSGGLYLRYYPQQTIDVSGSSAFGGAPTGGGKLVITVPTEFGLAPLSGVNSRSQAHVNGLIGTFASGQGLLYSGPLYQSLYVTDSATLSTSDTTCNISADGSTITMVGLNSGYTALTAPNTTKYIEFGIPTISIGGIYKASAAFDADGDSGTVIQASSGLDTEEATFIYATPATLNVTASASISSIKVGETKSFNIDYVSNYPVKAVTFEFRTMVVDTSDTYTINGVTKNLTSDQIQHPTLTEPIAGISILDSRVNLISSDIGDATNITLNLNNKTYTENLVTYGPGRCDVSVSQTGATPFRSFSNMPSWNIVTAIPAKSTAPDLANITIANNQIGINDTVELGNLSAGDIVNVYGTSTGGTALGTATVVSGATKASLSIPQLGTASGSLYISVINLGKSESDRTKADYGAETSSGLLNGTLQLSAAITTAAASTGQVQLTVNRTGGSEGVVTVDYATSDGTGIAGTDYTAASGTLTFADGETSKTFNVVLNTETTATEDKTFIVTLSNPGGGAILGTTKSSEVTIRNSEIAPGSAGQISFFSESFSGYGGRTAGMTIIRSDGFTGEVGVTWTTSGTAVAGTDFTGETTGTITFANGEKSKTVLFPISQTATDGKTIILTISSPTGKATVGVTNCATLKIQGYVADTKTKKKNAVKELKPVNPTIEVRPGTSTEALVFGYLNNGAMINLAGSEVTWSSAKPAIATVSNGVITGVTLGTTKVTATLDKKTTTFNVTTALLKTLEGTDSSGTIIPEPGKGIKTPELKLQLKATTTITLAATQVDLGDLVVTEGATWLSSNTNVATVTSQGVITTIGSGVSTITGSYGGKKVVAKVNTTLKSLVASYPDSTNPKYIFTPAAGKKPAELKMNPSDVAVALVVTVAYADDTTANVAADSDMTWTTSNDKVATVNEKGVITTTALPGVATVIGTYAGSTGKKVAISVNTNLKDLAATYPSPTSPTVIFTAGATTAKPSELKMKPGDVSNALVVTRYTFFKDEPADVAGDAVWTTSNDKIAAVDKGVITTSATKLGTVTITATYQGKKVTIKVNTAITGLAADKAELTMEPSGATGTIVLTANYANGNSDAGNVTATSAVWKSSNKKVAKVDTNGVVTSVGPGTAKITATYGGKTAKITVTVTAS